MSDLPTAFRQPDAYTCGQSCAVMVGQLRGRLPLVRSQSDFTRGVYALEREWSALRRGWPATLGTPPWLWRVVLEDAGGLAGLRWVPRAVGVGSVPGALPLYHMGGVLSSGQFLVVYVGSRWLPRHVIILVRLGDQVWCYEPARGQWTTRLEDGLAGWSHVWWRIGPGQIAN